MLKKVFAILLFQFAVIGFAQSQEITDTLGLPVVDSVGIEDSIIELTDPFVQAYFNVSFNTNNVYAKQWSFDKNASFKRQWIKKAYQFHPFYNFRPNRSNKVSDIKQFEGKELLFYALTGLLILFAVFKRVYTKYLKDLLRLFFRTTLKYSQISEQLLQNPLPSLLMNLFFVITGAFYITALLFYLKLSPVENFWLLLLYAAGLVAGVYLVKYVVLKLSGWLFNISTATDSYIFIVFIVNKIISIYLLPFIIIISFSIGQVQQVAVSLSWIGLAGLLGYRFILSYSSIRNLVKVNPFHFFLYLSAVEIAPLLILYKLVLIYI